MRQVFQILLAFAIAACGKQATEEFSAEQIKRDMLEDEPKSGIIAIDSLVVVQRLVSTPAGFAEIHLRGLFTRSKPIGSLTDGPATVYRCEKFRVFYNRLDVGWVRGENHEFTDCREGRTSNCHQITAWQDETSAWPRPTKG